MNKRMSRGFLTLYLLCGGATFGGLETARAQVPASTDTSVAGNTQLEAAKNTAILKAFAEQKRRIHSMDVMLPLINQGDPEAIKEVVEDLDSRIYPRQAEQTLEECVQPRVIAAVGDFLTTTESAQIKFGNDVGILPKSVEVGRIIQSILRKSSVFGDDVKRWAAGDLGLRLPGIDKSEFRRQMRVWWDQNRAAILAERYQDVRPPTPDAGTVN